MPPGSSNAPTTPDVFITKVVYPNGFELCYPLTYFHFIPLEIRKELDEIFIRQRCPCGWVQDNSLPLRSELDIAVAGLSNLTDPNDFKPTCCKRWTDNYMGAWRVYYCLNNPDLAVFH